MQFLYITILILLLSYYYIILETYENAFIEHMNIPLGP